MTRVRMSVPDTLTWVANADPLEVSAYNDALVEAAGHHPASEYAETYWLPLIGPSGLWALRRLVAGLERSPDGFTVPLRALAGELGLPGQGRNAPVVKTLARLAAFDFATIAGGRYLVRLALPPLTVRSVARLPEHLAAQLRAAS